MPAHTHTNTHYTGAFNDTALHLFPLWRPSLAAAAEPGRPLLDPATERHF